MVEQIAEALEQGVAPWVKPWKLQAGVSLPTNAATEAPYSGVNILILWLEGLARGYASPYWVE